MGKLKALFQWIDPLITRWMAEHGILFIRISLGVVFFWFGFLKFFSGLSPAEQLAGRTLEKLSFGSLPPQTSLPLLALWECLIGLGLLTGVAKRATLLLLYIQMAGTLLPLFFFPNETFIHFPYAPSLEGQYIIKNLVLISAGIVIGGTVRGGRLEPEPDRKKS